MHEAEISVLITDLILAIVCGISGWKLVSPHIHQRQRSRFFWGLGFITIAVSSVVAGIYHGFRPSFSPLGLHVIRAAIACMIALAVFFLEYGIAIASLPTRSQRIIGFIAFGKFCAISLWLIQHYEFLFSILNYAVGFLFVLILQTIALLRERSHSARWIVAGVLTAFFAAGIQQSGISMHRYFTHNDLYHLVQIGSFLLLYLGARHLLDWSKEAPPPKA